MVAEKEFQRDGSIAVWSKAFKNAEQKSINVHLNFWHLFRSSLHKRKAKLLVKDFLDIGLSIKNPQNIEAINLYLPFSVNSASIEDVGEKSARFACANGIDGDEYTCEVKADEKGLEVVDIDNNRSLCRINRFLLDEQKQIDKSALEFETYPDSTGTLLSIKTAAIQSASENLDVDGRVYFALRVYLDRKTIGTLLYQVRPLGRDFQGAYEAIECIDFHFNDRSRLPPSIDRKIRDDEKNEKVNIATATFAAILPIDSDISSCSFPWYKSELLDKTDWYDYVPGGIPNSMISYRWKFTQQEGEFSDCSTFLKMRTRVTGPKILQHYMTNIFIVSFLGNMTALILGVLSVKLSGLVVGLIVGAIGLLFLYSIIEIFQIIINTRS